MFWYCCDVWRFIKMRSEVFWVLQNEATVRVGNVTYAMHFCMIYLLFINTLTELFTVAANILLLMLYHCAKKCDNGSGSQIVLLYILVT